MHTVDEKQPPNSGENDDNSPAGLRNLKLKEVGNPLGRRSSGDSGIMLRFKLSSQSLSAAEVGCYGKISAGDEEKIPATKEKLNDRNCNEEFQSVTGFSSPTKAGAITTPMNFRSGEETPCNATPQQAIGNPKCNKKSVRLLRNCEKADRAKFFVSLSRHEIEQDFITITGKKPPGKPRRRPRVVQNQINAILPCRCLTEVHADHYKVKDN